MDGRSGARPSGFCNHDHPTMVAPHGDRRPRRPRVQRLRPPGGLRRSHLHGVHRRHQRHHARHRCRCRQQPLVHGGPGRRRRQDHAGGRRDRVRRRRSRRLRAGPHRRRTGREPVVRRARQRPDRQREHRWGDHRLRRAGSNPQDIAAGPDGNVWFTEGAPDAIGRVNLPEQPPTTPTTGGTGSTTTTARAGTGAAVAPRFTG